MILSTCSGMMARHMLMDKPPCASVPPKPRRLPQRKRMTIALGILASNGVVLAADTEESYEGWKGEHGKITGVGAQATKGGNCCLITGAGDALYIDAIARDLRELVSRNSATSTVEELLKERFPET